MTRAARFPALFSASLIFYAIMSLIGLAIAALRGHAGALIRLEHLGTDIPLGLGVGLVVVGVSRASLRIRAVRQVSLELGAAMDELELWQMRVVALCSGIAEEMMFRGSFPPIPGWGLMVATGVFSVIHIGRAWRYLWWTAFALVAGASFVGLYLRQESLVAPIVAHMTVNFLNIPYVVRLYRASGQDRTSWHQPDI